MSSWLSFESLWTANKATFSASCSQFDTDNNSEAENANLKSAIQNISNSTGIDQRLILAIVMQESKGCVRVWTTKYSVANPGLMQSHAGTGSCNTGISTGGAPTAGKISNPCPAASIQQMIHDGVAGTSSGDGLQQLHASSGGTNAGAQAYYKAARKYNSGSIASDGDLSSLDSVATVCYATDVANRLMGTLTEGPTGCTLS
ncbi:hypothetical protein Tdes44962_MAKER06388 [Teratosphaeria destructans]|uniref:Uncharacterized protein n=1 Tax=Teratosphaeria destructans TaxID=418781 RepID=A0A9W7SI42_9PEZI|nr:hypothetical protein Tdes44962_MAKER06388 [Teratosphaeria destructans]